LGHDGENGCCKPATIGEYFKTAAKRPNASVTSAAAYSRYGEVAVNTVTTHSPMCEMAKQFSRPAASPWCSGIETRHVAHRQSSFIEVPKKSRAQSNNRRLQPVPAVGK
jgi:hypothetical protein